LRPQDRQVITVAPQDVRFVRDFRLHACAVHEGALRNDMIGKLYRGIIQRNEVDAIRLEYGAKLMRCARAPVNGAAFRDRSDKNGHVDVAQWALFPRGCRSKQIDQRYLIRSRIMCV